MTISSTVWGNLSAGSAQPTQFDSVRAGTQIHTWTVATPGGWSATFCEYGARWLSWRAPQGRELVAGNPSLSAATTDSSYLGAIAGRYAGRIGCGTFSLDGTDFQIPVNDKGNALHGGPVGFSAKVWQAAETEVAGQPAVRLRLTSPAGDQGFPGELYVECCYVVTDGQVEILLSAQTEAPTPVNLTSHAYFQLDGPAGIRDEWLTVFADQVLAIDQDGRPTGKLWPVQGTDFDLRASRSVRRAITSTDPRLVQQSGFDHTYVLAARASREAVLAAQVTSADGARMLSVLTDQPSLQVYLSQWLTPDTGLEPYRAVCLEAQQFPDAPNHPNFPDATVRPGQGYRSRIVYRLSSL